MLVGEKAFQVTQRTTLQIRKRIGCDRDNLIVNLKRQVGEHSDNVVSFACRSSTLIYVYPSVLLPYGIVVRGELKSHLFL